MISINHGTLEDLQTWESQIPEFEKHNSLEKLKSRLSNKGLILKAVEAGEVLGFKAGYPLNETTFYSWVGGVFPRHRGKGVAQKLLDHQEAFVKTQGFQTIRVKSMNRYKSMIVFLLKNDYCIVGYDDQGDPWKSKIRFEKQFY